MHPWPRVEFGGLKVRNPSKWWRPDGTRPVVGEPTDGLLLHDPTKYDESGELTAIRLLREAIATGDDQAIERAADEAEAADRDEKRRFARLAADRKRREAKRAAERRKIWELEAKGWDRFEAEAEVTGHSAENLRRWAFMEQARAEGHQGKTFEALVRSVHRTLSLAAEAASEETTNGHSLKREFEGPHRLAGPVGDVRPGSPQVCVGGAVVVVRPARPHHPRRCPPARPVRRVDRVRAPRPAPRGLPPMSSQYPTGYQGYPYSEPFAPHQPYGVAGIRQALAEGAAARSEPVRLVRVDGIDWPVVPANPYAGRSPVLAAMWLHGYQGVEEKGPADGGLQLPR